MEKYGSLFLFISKQICRATMKNVLADGKGGCVADGSAEQGGGGRNKPTNLILTQSLHIKYTCGKRTVPYSSSLYTVFHSVIFNSVYFSRRQPIILKIYGANMLRVCHCFKLYQDRSCRCTAFFPVLPKHTEISTAWHHLIFPCIPICKQKHTFSEILIASEECVWCARLWSETGFLYNTRSQLKLKRSHSETLKFLPPVLSKPRTKQTWRIIHVYMCQVMEQLEYRNIYYICSHFMSVFSVLQQNISFSWLPCQNYTNGVM